MQQKLKELTDVTAVRDQILFSPKQYSKRVTIKQAAEMTGVSRWTFYRLLREKKLTKYMNYSTVFVNLEEFERITEPPKK